mgnify:CR=1 FL=1
MSRGGHLRWGVGSRSIHPGVRDLGGPGVRGCMYILYIYPRVRAVGFSMGPNHRIYPPFGGAGELHLWSINGGIIGLILSPNYGCIYSI